MKNWNAGLDNFLDLSPMINKFIFKWLIAEYKIIHPQNKDVVNIPLKVL